MNNIQHAGFVLGRSRHRRRGPGSFLYKDLRSCEPAFPAVYRIVLISKGISSLSERALKNP